MFLILNFTVQLIKVHLNGINKKRLKKKSNKEKKKLSKLSYAQFKESFETNNQSNNKRIINTEKSKSSDKNKKFPTSIV
jgi:hypothetical protein